MLSGVAHSLSFGAATAHSTQGQTLQVRIALNNAAGHELFDINVEQILGGKARELGFAGAALDTAYTVEVMSNGHGKMWVEVSGDEVFREPYAEFLLQLDSSDERLLSEYRVSVPSAKSQDTYLIKPGDSLGRIAQSIRPDEAIQLRAIVSYLHVNNLQAFAQGDINRIVVGAHLQLPSASDYAAMPRRDLTPANAVKAVSNSTPKSELAVRNEPAETSKNESSEVGTYAVEPVAVLDDANTEIVATKIKAEDVAELEWVELGAVNVPEDYAEEQSVHDQSVEPPEVELEKEKTTDDRMLVKPIKSQITAVSSDTEQSSLTGLWWLFIPLGLFVVVGIFVARHYWRFARVAETPQPVAPCEKTARVLALEKKLARQQAYKKSQAEKQQAARQRVRELEEKLAKIQRNKKPVAAVPKAAKKAEIIELTGAVAAKAAPIVIEPNTELTQVPAREDLSVESKGLRPAQQCKKERESAKTAVSADDPLAQSPRKRDADDEQVIEDFYKLFDRD